MLRSGFECQAAAFLRRATAPPLKSPPVHPLQPHRPLDHAARLGPVLDQHAPLIAARRHHGRAFGAVDDIGGEGDYGVDLGATRGVTSMWSMPLWSAGMGGSRVG